jgi:hypothetical protein
MLLDIDDDYNDQLEDNGHHECQACDLQIGEFKNFDQADADAETDDVIQEDVVAAEVPTHREAYSYAQTDRFEDSEFEGGDVEDLSVQEFDPEEEEQFVGADAYAEDAKDEAEDGEADVDGWIGDDGDDGANYQDDDEEENQPHVDLDASPSQRPGFGVHCDDGDEDGDHEDLEDESPLESIGRIAELAVHIIGHGGDIAAR